MSDRKRKPIQATTQEDPKHPPKQDSPVVPLLVIVIPMLLLVLYGVLVD